MDATPPKIRRWPVALLVGFITAVFAACGIIPISDWVMQQHDVSNFEGGRAYAVAFLWIPLAAITGFVIGFVVPLLVRRKGLIGYLIPQGIALGIGFGLIALIAGIGYATADHPPLIDDQPLALEIQVQVPANGRTMDDLKSQGFSVALVASTSDRSYAEMRWSESSATNDTVVATAWANLNSRIAGREITVGAQDQDRQIFSVILPASPKKTDEQWSEWAGPRATFSGKMPSPNEQYRVRYRVRFASEYSPTPSETPATEATPEENKTPASFPALTPDAQHQWSPPNDSLDRGLIPPSPTETPQP